MLGSQSHIKFAIATALVAIAGSLGLKAYSAYILTGYMLAFTLRFCWDYFLGWYVVSRYVRRRHPDLFEKHMWHPYHEFGPVLSMLSAGKPEIKACVSSDERMYGLWTAHRYATGIFMLHVVCMVVLCLYTIHERGFHF